VKLYHRLAGHHEELNEWPEGSYTEAKLIAQPRIKERRWILLQGADVVPP
jgi:hypothetical protein